MKVIKCSNCKQWTDNDKKHCLFCGFEHHKQQKIEREHLKKPLDAGFPFIKIQQTDPIFIKAGKGVVLFFQIIVYGIVSLIMYLASSVVH
ncbi:hypothetical protein JCM31826_02910 [Thermaurantimonas aggregans]|uniref:Uncharacterized protein n=1 Tax=Thermaurantimonas aggregans TaxID=2173829 RepID=A0A401XIG8_9FLAO|nr:hypothetical protein [Thermaurantimonas aggregans]MCX8148752.1 hypothetical protein [Thermaurantimonas aggregans]GCD76809.1 hypothetical protein JCM31826_02910 [Thermaurantimonas aggregans]